MDTMETESQATDRIEQMLFPSTPETQPEVKEPEAVEEPVEAPTESPDQPEEAEQVEETEEERVEIEIDGERYEVPEKLKEAFLKNKDYTQKTQELAEQRKLFQQEREQAQRAFEVQQKFQAEYQDLTAIHVKLQQFETIDWQALANDNVTQFLALKEQRDQLQRTLDTRSTALNQAVQQFMSEQETRKAQTLTQAVEKLKSSIKGWNDDLASSLRSSLKDYGFSPDEAGFTPFNSDPRYVQVLHDAYQFRQLKQGLPVTKKVTQQGRTLRPGAPVKPPSAKQSLKQAVRAAGSDDAKAKAIEGFLTRKFGG